MEGKGFVNIEGLTHSPNDPYHVMESLDFPLLSDDWTAEEELMLLQGLVETRGAANWDKVAEFVGKPSNACRAHYNEFYINSATAPLPDVDRFDVPTTMEEARERRAALNEEDGASQRGSGEEIYRHKKGGRAGKSVRGGGRPGAPAAGEGRRMRPAPGVVKEVEGAGEEVGYCPTRGTFDVEWDDEAEVFSPNMMGHSSLMFSDSNSRP